jgi:hypothetical protein
MKEENTFPNVMEPSVTSINPFPLSFSFQNITNINIPNIKGIEKKNKRKIPKKITKWLIEEQKNFLKGYKMYKEDWEKISKFYVPTRTAEQIKKYAEKKFSKEYKQYTHKNKNKGTY